MTDAKLMRGEHGAAIRRSADDTVGAKARAIGTLAHAKSIAIRSLRQETGSAVVAATPARRTANA